MEVHSTSEASAPPSLSSHLSPPLSHLLSSPLLTHPFPPYFPTGRATQGPQDVRGARGAAQGGPEEWRQGAHLPYLPLVATPPSYLPLVWLHLPLRSHLPRPSLAFSQVIITQMREREHERVRQLELQVTDTRICPSLVTFPWCSHICPPLVTFPWWLQDQEREAMLRQNHEMKEEEIRQVTGLSSPSLGGLLSPLPWP